MQRFFFEKKSEGVKRGKKHLVEYIATIACSTFLRIKQSLPTPARKRKISKAKRISFIKKIKKQQNSFQSFKERSEA
ncbi:hypothetical protein Nepgr_020595 [Nepenthes gracilis]|uniref:Uncharacterized protein n=1 Tax=Nepenthes gracilis TaxID=150966 RepID=A0AAD3SXX0_NEPGR|nr:hypothetical protein Nepgr_020595 [Nepenthes gracilis]